MERVAVVGLGAMGSPVAARLLACGYDVVVWNRTPERAAALGELGAVVAESPAAASRGAAAVLVAVTGPQALCEVTEGARGVAAGVGPGAVVVQLSTVSAASLARLGAALPTGAGLLDAPVLGSVTEAASGTLRLLVGGPDDLVERCRPLLERLGTVLHVGPTGHGTAAKLVANNALFGVLGVLGESLAFGRAQGLGREALHQVLAVTPLAEQAARRRAAVEADAYPVRFALPLARKDADLVADAARDLGLDLGLTAAARHWLTEAEQAGRGGQDYSAVLAHILQQTSDGKREVVR